MLDPGVSEGRLETMTDINDPWRDPEGFRKLYIDEGYTQEELAEHWGCSTPTVASWAKRHGLLKSQQGSPSGPAEEAIGLLKAWKDLPSSLREGARKLLHEAIDKLPD